MVQFGYTCSVRQISAYIELHRAMTLFGPRRDKTVFRVSNKVRLKSVSTATEAS